MELCHAKPSFDHLSLGSRAYKDTFQDLQSNPILNAPSMVARVMPALGTTLQLAVNVRKKSAQYSQLYAILNHACNIPLFNSPLASSP